MPKKKKLDIKTLVAEAARFAEVESTYDEPSLYGVTDGKAVGTYLEHKFTHYLATKYEYQQGNSASGIDFPGIEVDMKVTSIRQPQSSCPFKSARHKIFGLGYNLLVFVYEKSDDHKMHTGRLNIQHTIFVDESRTSDFQMTKGILQILENEGNADDIIAFLHDRNLPIDDIEACNSRGNKKKSSKTGIFNHIQCIAMATSVWSGDSRSRKNHRNLPSKVAIENGKESKR